MAAHSDIAGGSTCERVMACPASIKMVAAMPRKPSSSYADEGTLLHKAMESIYGDDIPPREVIGNTYEGIVLTEELFEEKVIPAMAAIDEIDPEVIMGYEVEAEVSFGDYLPGVFGSADMIGRINDRAIVVDYKFGTNPVIAEESAQGMFYAAAAMRTPKLNYYFEGATEVEIVIVQPPHVRRWVTTPSRVKQFEKDLKAAIKLGLSDNPPAPKAGDHCKWCAAKPTCPQFTGAVDRALKAKIDALDLTHINAYLKQAELLEDWIKDLRELATLSLEHGKVLPDWKLVAKRGSRKWAEDADVLGALTDLGLTVDQVTPRELISAPAAEKLLKKIKKELPEDIVTKVSSGSTLVEASDPRPAVVAIGAQLTAALSKLV